MLFRSDADGSRFLVLTDGTRYEGKPGDKDFQVIEYEEYGQFIEKEEAELRRRRRTAIPTLDLIEDLTPRNLSELHWRLALILMVWITCTINILYSLHIFRCLELFRRSIKFNSLFCVFVNTCRIYFNYYFNFYN